MWAMAKVSNVMKIQWCHVHDFHGQKNLTKNLIARWEVGLHVYFRASGVQIVHRILQKHMETNGREQHSPGIIGHIFNLLQLYWKF